MVTVVLDSTRVEKWWVCAFAVQEGIMTPGDISLCVFIGQWMDGISVLFVGTETGIGEMHFSWMV